MDIEFPEWRVELRALTKVLHFHIGDDDITDVGTCGEVSLGEFTKRGGKKVGNNQGKEERIEIEVP